MCIRDSMMTGPASTAMATGTRSAPSTAAVPKKMCIRDRYKRIG